MKKAFIFVGLILMVDTCFAFERDSVWKDWRSSETITADTDVSISTGLIYLKDFVTARIVGESGTVQFFNSSGTVANGVSRTSSTIYGIPISTGTTVPIDQVYSRGLRYTKTGTSGIVIRWDYHSLIEPGQERRGFK